MSSKVVIVGGCKRNLVVEVSREEVDSAIRRLAGSYASRAKVPGFRPGKVPLNVVLQRFAADLRDEARQEIISRSWKEAVEEHGLKPLTEPHVEEIQGEAGEDLRFTISFEVMPQLEIADLKGSEVRIQPASVDDGEVDLALQAMREQHAQFAPLEDAAIADGHLVTLKVDGEFEDGGKPIQEDDVTLIVGDARTSDDFSANLRGTRVGEVREFSVSFAPDSPRKRLAGKKVHYRVEVKDVKEKNLPELNDDFARDAGSDNLQELRGRVRDELVRNAERLAEEKAKEEILDKNVRALSFDVPEALIAAELEDRAQQIAAKLAYQGIDVNKTSINWKKIFEEERPHAELGARRKMVLDAIARQESLTVTEEELDLEFQRLAQGSDKSAPALRAQFEKDQRIQSVRARLMRQKALDFAYRNATITQG